MMSISAPFIRRPVATALLMVAIVLLGGTAYELLPVAALPNVAFPTISVTGELPGTDPQTMASSVATPLEKQFGQIPYLTQMTSTSSLGYTNITLQFALSDNISSAATLVQAAINAAAGQLPKDMFTQPTYHETNPADAPILVLGLTSDTLPITTVDDYAESVLEQKLSQVPGVGLVSVGGEQHPSVRIQFNPAQLAANGLDLEDVRTALTNVSVDQPKGTLYGQARAFTLQTNDQILKSQDWSNQIIAWRNGGPIRVSDVGQAAVGPQDITLKGWVNLHRGIILAIERLPGANVIQTVQAVKAALPQLQASIPSAIKISVIADRTTTIRASVADVQFTLMLTIALVVMVIFLFLRSAWPTVIPGIAVPVSIVGTFGVMYAFGYSLDNLSLMGLSIAVGFVVDDAIVMVENIARHIEMGKKPMQAALDGAAEIGFTILSISISLVAVFIPLLLMGGVVGRLFQEFAVTVTVAIAVSALVSLTLTPVMGARLLRQEHPEAQGWLSRALEWCFDALLAAYDRALVVALRHRFITLMAMLATVAATAWLFIIIPKGFFPTQDTGLLLGVTEAAEDISPAGMSAIQEKVIGTALKDPAVLTVGGYIGAGGATSTENQGRIFIALKPKPERPPIGQVMARLSHAVQAVVGVRLYLQPVQDIVIGGRLTATQYQYTLTDIDLTELNKWAPIVQSAIGKLPQVIDLASDQQSAGPQLTLAINRDTAARLGITSEQIDGVLYDAFGQRQIAQLYTSLNQYFCHHGGKSRLPTRSGWAATDLCPLADRRHGTAERTGHAAADGGAAGGQSPGAVSLGDAQLQPAGQRAHRPGRDGDPTDDGRPACAADNPGQLPRQRPGLPVLALEHADPDPCSAHRCLHHPRYALREHHSPADDHLHLAVGGSWGVVGSTPVRVRPGYDGDHRHHSADRHRQEERDNARGLRAGCGAPSRSDPGRVDL
jgi:multidrug efflux pump subunit AcrB